MPRRPDAELVKTSKFHEMEFYIMPKKTTSEIFFKTQGWRVVGHEMPIHHVQVKQIHLALLHLLDLPFDISEISRQ